MHGLTEKLRKSLEKKNMPPPEIPNALYSTSEGNTVREAGGGQGKYATRVSWLTAPTPLRRSTAAEDAFPAIPGADGLAQDRDVLAGLHPLVLGHGALLELD